MTLGLSKTSATTNIMNSALGNPLGFIVVVAFSVYCVLGADIRIDPTLGDSKRFSSVKAYGSIGDSSYGPVDTVEFEASGESKAAQKIVDIFNNSKKIAIVKPIDDRYKFSSLLFGVTLTCPEGELTLTCCSEELVLVKLGGKKQWYLFEDPFSPQGFVPQFSELLFLERDAVDLKLRELSRDINEFGPPRRSKPQKSDN